VWVALLQRGDDVLLLGIYKRIAIKALKSIKVERPLPMPEELDNFLGRRYIRQLEKLDRAEAAYYNSIRSRSRHVGKCGVLLKCKDLSCTYRVKTGFCTR
jgi:hypothetical protein